MKLYINLLRCIWLIGTFKYSDSSSNFRRKASRASNKESKSNEDTILKSSSISRSSREKDEGGLTSLPKIVGSLGVLGAVGFGLYIGINKLIKYINDKKVQESLKLSPYIDVMKLLESTISVSTGTPTIMDDSYICLIFDCDAKLQEVKDKKARGDYFSLMANITNNVSKGNNKMTTVYIPGKGNGNIIESDINFKKSTNHWNYLDSKPAGEAASKALRTKFSIRPEELRIVILDAKGKIISDNALDLLRIDPKVHYYYYFTFYILLTN